MSAKLQIQALINLAITDMHFAEEERDLIYLVGRANGVEQPEINDMIANPQPMGSLESLTESERFEMLYNVVQLMKIDRKVYVVEIKYCEDIAMRLGYNKKVVKELSSKVYANPTITADKEHLEQIVRRYKDE